MSNEDLPINQGAITLKIDRDGNMAGTIKWNLEKDLPEECVDVMVESLHGLLSMILTQPDKVMEMGAAYLLGATSENDDEPEQLELDFGDLATHKPSKQRH